MFISAFFFQLEECIVKKHGDTITGDCTEIANGSCETLIYLQVKKCRNPCALIYDAAIALLSFGS